MSTLAIGLGVFAAGMFLWVMNLVALVAVRAVLVRINRGLWPDEIPAPTFDEAEFAVQAPEIARASRRTNRPGRYADAI